MAAATAYSLNVVDESGTGAGPYHVDVLKNPSTVASGEQAPSVTTGPLGSTGKASAKDTNGAGSKVGFTSLGDAAQKAVLFMLDDKALNNT